MAQAGAQRVGAILRGVEDCMSGAALVRVQKHVGGKAKGQALGAAAKGLGGDRAMRNFKSGRIRLGAGWDAIPHGVVINLRPGGMWKLAEAGRRRSGTIRPKAKRRRARKGEGRGRPAVSGPKGYSASVPYKPSRGVKSITTARKDIERVAGRATDAAIAKELARVVR